MANMIPPAQSIAIMPMGDNAVAAQAVALVQQQQLEQQLLVQQRLQQQQIQQQQQRLEQLHRQQHQLQFLQAAGAITTPRAHIQQQQEPNDTLTPALQQQPQAAANFVNAAAATSSSSPTSLLDNPLGQQFATTNATIQQLHQDLMGAISPDAIQVPSPEDQAKHAQIVQQHRERQNRMRVRSWWHMILCS